MVDVDENCPLKDTPLFFEDRVGEVPQAFLGAALGPWACPPSACPLNPGSAKTRLNAGGGLSEDGFIELGCGIPGGEVTGRYLGASLESLVPIESLHPTLRSALSSLGSPVAGVAKSGGSRLHSALCHLWHAGYHYDSLSPQVNRATIGRRGGVIAGGCEAKCLHDVIDSMGASSRREAEDIMNPNGGRGVKRLGGRKHRTLDLVDTEATPVLFSLCGARPACPIMQRARFRLFEQVSGGGEGV